MFVKQQEINTVGTKDVVAQLVKCLGKIQKARVLIPASPKPDVVGGGSCRTRNSRSYTDVYQG